MNHLASYKLFEASDVTEIRFKPYFDKMSNDDRRRMDSILDKGPGEWSKEDREFLQKMSKKDVFLFVDADRGKVYTRDEVIAMGYDADNIEKHKAKNPDFYQDAADLIDNLKKSLYKSNDILRKYDEEYNFTKIIKPFISNIESTIYALEKLV